MRTAFFETLEQLAESDDRITLMVGDLGFGVVEGWSKRFPARFVNVGVAEQNMAGLAAGMALCGKTVFTYSIANFPTLRCLEQVRNDICHHRANVKIVAVGGGFCYGSLGMSHHAIEDLGIMRMLPELLVIAPADPTETRAATQAIAAYEGPCYLRLGRAGEPVVHVGTINFQLGKAVRVRDGKDLTIISTGGMLRTACDVAHVLAEEGINPRVLSMHTIKPLDVNAVIAAAQETHFIFTLEEHSIFGGLGGAVAEVVAESGIPVRFRRIGVPPISNSHVGSQEYLRDQFDLSPKKVLATIRANLNLAR